MIPDPHAFDERAAIREFDAGFSREEAERLARLDVTPEQMRELWARHQEFLAATTPEALQASRAARQDRPASVSRAFAGTLPSPRTVSGGSCSSLEAQGTAPAPA